MWALLVGASGPRAAIPCDTIVKDISGRQRHHGEISAVVTFVGHSSFAHEDMKHYYGLVPLRIR